MSLPPSFFTLFAIAVLTTNSFADESETVLPLTKGDTWEYQVTVSAPAGAQLPEGEDVKIQKTSDGQQATFKKSRIYKGKTKPQPEGREFDTFVLTRLGKIAEYEFLSYTTDSILAIGSKDETVKDSKLYLAGTPLLIYSSQREAGDEWKVSISGAKEGVENNRRFKVFGEETVVVPAGTFQAIRMEMSGKSGPVEIKQTYWFAPGTGFIKEIMTTYSTKTRLFNQIMELTKFTKGKG